jgi:hypothetical protein
MNFRNPFLCAALLVMSIGNSLAADRFIYEVNVFQKALAAGKPVLEAALLRASPEWLSDIPTRF